MLFDRKIRVLLAAAAIAAGPTAIIAPLASGEPRSPVAWPVLVELAPGDFRYSPSGEFTQAGKPANPRVGAARIDRRLSIMKDLVSAGDYQRCVDEGACKSRDSDDVEFDMPTTMVSWRDAQAYAAWLSAKLHARFRLPTDEEWTFAAGRRAPDEGQRDGAGDDPIARWMDRYARESRQQPTDPTPQRLGSFGVNENGLADIAGNVWEWTDTCYTRAALAYDGQSPARVETVNCGVRAVEGRHRTYVSDFIRDARAGGCAAGVPPSNLGFRLVREEPRSWWMF